MIQHFHVVGKDFWYNVTMLKQRLKPDRIISSFKELDFAWFDTKVVLILVDCDNTLLNKATHEFNHDGIEWVHQAKARGMNVVLMSNNRHPLFETLSAQLDTPLIQMAMKPISPHYARLKKKYALKPSQIVVIGDQLLTDIMGAKLHGFKCVYHKPLSRKDVGYNKPIRNLEKKWIEEYESTM